MASTMVITVVTLSIILTAVIALTASSISVGNNPNGLVLQRYMNLTSDQAHTLTGGARYAVVLLPVLVGVVGALVSLTPVSISKGDGGSDRVCAFWGLQAAAGGVE